MAGPLDRILYISLVSVATRQFRRRDFLEKKKAAMRKFLLATISAILAIFPVPAGPKSWPENKLSHAHSDSPTHCMMSVVRHCTGYEDGTLAHRRAHPSSGVRQFHKKIHLVI